MSRFTRFFSGKFQYFGKCAGVKQLTNIMSGRRSRIQKPMSKIMKEKVLTLLVGGGLDVGDQEVGLGGEGEVAGEDEHQLLGVPLLQH